MLGWVKEWRQVMARKRFKAAEIICKLREAEVEQSRGMALTDVFRKLGITEQTYYRWRKEYGGLRIDQAKRLRELEKENQRLKQAVADVTLDKTILKEALEGNY
jgi:putative transposase